MCFKIMKQKIFVNCNLQERKKKYNKTIEQKKLNKKQNKTNFQNQFGNKIKITKNSK